MTGNIYHAEYDPPPDDSEVDPGPLVQREDDKEEAIRHHLRIYHEQTEPLKDYYADREILVTVDATQGIPEVMQAILEGITVVQALKRPVDGLVRSRNDCVDRRSTDRPGTVLGVAVMLTSRQGFT